MNVLGQLGLEYGIEILARPLSDQAIGVGKCREAADLIRVLEHQARRHCLSLLIGLILPSSVVSAPPFAEEHAAGDLLKKDTFEPVINDEISNSLSNDERLKE